MQLADWGILNLDIFKLFDYSFYLYCVLFLLYDNCIVNLYISYLDLIVVGPHQLYSCLFKPTYQINVFMYVWISQHFNLRVQNFSYGYATRVKLPQSYTLCVFCKNV